MYYNFNLIWLIMFYVYVLHNKEFDKIYIGFTSNLESRVAAHNHPQNKGWTKKFKPWLLIYSEEFKVKSEAMRREQQLKSAQGRKFIRENILNK